jgi:metal-responsive CopG/Arc/MetJ family transcriptional regulator
MGTVKMTISVDDALLRRVRQLARALGVTRSQLFALALEEYLDRQRGREVEARLNEVYAKPIDREDRQTLRLMRSAARKLADKW